MNIWVRVISGIFGLSLEVVVLDAAIRTFLLPRVARVRLSRMISRTVGWFFNKIADRTDSYAGRDHVLSLFASIVLLTYQAIWLILSLIAFAFGFIAAGVGSFATAFKCRAPRSSPLARRPPTARPRWCSATSKRRSVSRCWHYSSHSFDVVFAFQSREFSVSRLSVRAGIPATPWGVLEIAQSVDSYERLDEIWREWEQWFIEIGETHSTLVILNYYRSSNPNQTWIGSAAAVLDSAALFNAAVDVKPVTLGGTLHSLRLANSSKAGRLFQGPLSRRL